MKKFVFAAIAALAIPVAANAAPIVVTGATYQATAADSVSVKADLQCFGLKLTGKKTSKGAGFFVGSTSLLFNGNSELDTFTWTDALLNNAPLTGTIMDRNGKNNDGTTLKLGFADPDDRLAAASAVLSFASSIDAGFENVWEDVTPSVNNYLLTVNLQKGGAQAAITESSVLNVALGAQCNGTVTIGRKFSATRL